MLSSLYHAIPITKQPTEQEVAAVLNIWYNVCKHNNTDEFQQSLFLGRADWSFTSEKMWI